VVGREQLLELGRELRERAVETTHPTCVVVRGEINRLQRKPFS
jgi:hypothetical protein